jgi:hypothetical protein
MSTPVVMAILGRSAWVELELKRVTCGWAIVLRSTSEGPPWCA